MKNLFQLISFFLFRARLFLIQIFEIFHPKKIYLLELRKQIILSENTKKLKFFILSNFLVEHVLTII